MVFARRTFAAMTEETSLAFNAREGFFFHYQVPLQLTDSAA